MKTAILMLGLVCVLACATPIPSDTAAVIEENNIREAVFRHQFLHNASKMQQNAKVYFVSVGGGDPSEEIMRRFAGHDPMVKPRSAVVAGDAIQDSESGERGLIFNVGVIHWINGAKVKVEGGYREGDISASDNTYYLKKSGDEWVVTKDVERRKS